MDKTLKLSIEKAHDYNEQENLFGIDMTLYNLKEPLKKFDIYKNLW
jgi:hypothetical protein